MQAWPFTLTIFLSAFLLFEVQPLMGKYILPWFGGTSNVWTTCMLVYQGMLLLGYLYAHAISKLPLRKQAIIHMLALAASLALFVFRIPAWEAPILPGTHWRPQTDSIPVWNIIMILAAGIGLPFTILSSTSTLLQSWFSRLYPGKTPYVFYMVSNIGSLLALASYPFIIEPLLAVRTQALAWSSGYVIVAILYGYCATLVMKAQHGTAEAQHSARLDNHIEAKPLLKTRLSWLFLSMCSSAILLATTNQITQNVAPVPLLWVLPLAIYLLSFVISFRRNAPESKDFWIPAVLASQCFTLYSMETNSLMQIAALTLTLFACCMLSHKELYRQKPHPAHLTTFYLMIALGGVIGGIAVCIAAPLLFTTYFEFDFILIIYAIISLCILSTNRQQWMKYWGIPISIAFLIVTIIFQVNARNDRKAAICKSRNFYGTLTVRRIKNERGVYKELINGRIKHGIQYETGLLRKWPTEYFGEGSGIGKAFRYNLKRLSNRPVRVGAIGLGIGTIAAYGYKDDYIRFYEINPDVIKIATRTNLFSYIADSEAKIDIIPGDARISMENEKSANLPGAFDLLVIDAFNGDAIPVHLLTKEAFALYSYHMAPDAVIAIHVSNAYLDLVPVVSSAAKHYGMNSAVIKAYGDRRLTQTTLWVLLTRNPAFTEQPAIKESELRRDQISKLDVLWTDDYSNVFRLMKNPFK